MNNVKATNTETRNMTKIRDIATKFGIILILISFIPSGMGLDQTNQNGLVSNSQIKAAGVPKSKRGKINV